MEWLQALTLGFSILSAAVLAAWALRSNISSAPSRVQSNLEMKATEVKAQIDRQFAEFDRKLEAFRAEWLHEHLKLAEKEDLRMLERKVDDLIVRLGFHIKNDN